MPEYNVRTFYGGISVSDISMFANEIIKKYKIHRVPVDLDVVCKHNNLSVEKYDFTKIEEKEGHQISGMIKYDNQKQSGIILINERDSDERQRFTIAHELGHFFLHIPNSDDGVIVSFRGAKSDKETEANEFAAELLMPREQVRKEYDEAFFRTSTYLAERFAVSTSAMKIKLKEMGLNYFG